MSWYNVINYNFKTCVKKNITFPCQLNYNELSQDL